MSNADRMGKQGLGDSKPRHPGPGVLMTFRCDRCQQNKSTTGRKRVRKMFWWCKECQ